MKMYTLIFTIQTALLCTSCSWDHPAGCYGNCAHAVDNCHRDMMMICGLQEAGIFPDTGDPCNPLNIIAYCSNQEQACRMTCE